MTKQKRAKSGGEYGANGEWYEGGKFIATADRQKRKTQHRKGRKVEIEPYVWVQDTGRTPIMRRYGAYFWWENGIPTGLNTKQVLDYYKQDPVEGERALSAYKAGKRYIEEINEPEVDLSERA